MKLGIYFFAVMEWACNVGYSLFPWVNDAPLSNPQNAMHLAVTVLVVVFSLVSLVLVTIGARMEQIKSLSIWAIVCLVAMLIGPMSTALLPKAVFGLFERFSTFSNETALDKIQISVSIALCVIAGVSTYLIFRNYKREKLGGVG